MRHIPSAFVIGVAALTLSACASALRPCDGSEYPTFYRESLIRKVTLADAERRWLAQMELETIPAEARAKVIESTKESLAEFESQTLPTDELWIYRYEKCAGCGWYTEGLVALRESCIAAELPMKDDM